MADTAILRTTKFGNGFVKKDVIAYLDQLNSKINELNVELKSARRSAPESDPDEIQHYKNQIENLQERLNRANAMLRTAVENHNREVEELKNQLRIAEMRAEANR